MIFDIPHVVSLAGYTDSTGYVYTGDNGFTVTDTYTCNNTPCGGFTIGGPVAAAGGASTTGVTTTNLEFLGSTSYDSSGGMYTGSNGYTVTDSYSCGSGACGGYTMGSFPSTVVTAGDPSTSAVTTTNLEFLNSSSVDSAGNVYDGTNGYTVVDSYSCGSGECGGFTMGSFPSTVAAAGGASTTGVTTTNLEFLNSSSFDGAGNEYTGSNGYTVVDSYSCGSGECGGFTMGSYPATVAAGGASTTGVTTTNLDFVNSSSFDSAGNEYTGNNGFTVTDTYTCGSDCGGFTVTPVYGTLAADAGSVAVATQLSAPIQPAAVKEQTKPVRPHFSHYLMCGHAIALGAVSATISAGEKMMKGEKVDAESWDQEFKKTAEEAAKSVTPVGGYVLSNHVFAKAQEA
mmetsp:Transcript_11347/g.17844  ORF Transcript_11347/g.17844 Transcript_11347/m.17844 type:complete len:400 (+) Transcript_11347:3-1202(+)